MNSSFPNRWSFSYLKFTKYVTNIIAEPKYKYGQQEQVTVRNHNRSTALERSVLKYWGWGLKPVLRVPNLALGKSTSVDSVRESVGSFLKSLENDRRTMAMKGDLVRSNYPLNDRWVWYFHHLSRKKHAPRARRARGACFLRDRWFGLSVHAFCGTGDENIMPTCREAGN